MSELPPIPPCLKCGQRTLMCLCAVRELSARTSFDQPPPTPEDAAKPAVWDLVRADLARTVDADMRERDQVGRARYGTPLQPFNGRDQLADAYAEALDLVVYLRAALYERDGR